MSEASPPAAPGPGEPPGRALRLAFGDCELDVASGELHRGGRVFRLEPQPAKVLLFLLARAGEVVTREELRRHLWPDGQHVEADQGLNYCVRELRIALADSAREPRYLETLRRRGYRFLAAPEAAAHPPAATALRIAVLPFEACGLPDDRVGRAVPATVISRLARLAPRGLGVVAATSSFAYAERSLTAREIGRELRATYVVEGTFHRENGEARLDVHLVDTEEDAVIWSDSYAVDGAHLDALAAAVADGVAGELASAPPEAG